MLYADGITLFSETEEGLQNGINILNAYCNRWKLQVNISKTKVVIFRKGSTIPKNLKFYYDGQELEIVSSFSYLGIVFTSGSSFSGPRQTLAGQAQKAIFKLNSYLHKFTNINVKHTLELFDKLVTPIMNYGAEVWGFCKAVHIERIHLQFCKRLLGVKISTQNNFIYGELGRTSCQIQRYLIIVRFWLKIVNTSANKYIRAIYHMILRDLEVSNQMDISGKAFVM